MARGRTGGDLLFGMVVAVIAAYLWLQYRKVSSTVKPDMSSLGSGGGTNCTSYSTPDLNLGGMVIPGEQRTVCLG